MKPAAGRAGLPTLSLRCSVPMSFLCLPFQNPRFPGNLQMSDRQLDEAGESDVNNL